MSIKVLHRPARVEETSELDAEFRAARWAHHRLLDFEFEHQALMDAAFPKLARVGRLLARLRKRDRWRERATSGTWSPPPKPGLRESLEQLRADLRAERDADPEWKRVKTWPLERAGEKSCRRKAGETDEAFEARALKAYRTRRDAHALAVYAERRCYWASFNAAKASVDQALKAVLKRRKEGLPADLRRPRWSDPGRIVAQASQGGFEIVAREGVWWTLRMRLFDGWATFRAKLGNCHAMPEDASVREVELCRERDGNRWLYSVSVTVRASWPATTERGDGFVGIDTGHRKMGGDLRAFVWYGSDGKAGEVRLPAECAANLDKAHKLQGEIDAAYLKLEAPERSRHAYRKRLQHQGVPTEAEDAWLRWETARERQCARLRRRARNLRSETYTQAVRELRARYRFMGIDVVGKSVQREQTDEMVRRDVRQRRDLVAAYSIKELCERFGIENLAVTARNSTAECPRCGHTRKTKADLWLRCDSCGLSADQDHSAAYVLMCRAVAAARKQDSNDAESAAE